MDEYTFSCSLVRRGLCGLLVSRFARNCFLEFKFALEFGASFSKMNIALAFHSVTDYLQFIWVISVNIEILSTFTKTRENGLHRVYI